jgi:hypothetical protein
MEGNDGEEASRRVEVATSGGASRGAYRKGENLGLGMESIEWRASMLL